MEDHKDGFWEPYYKQDGYFEIFEDPAFNPWEGLKHIQKKLADGEPLPTNYAQWLGEAIRLSDEDPDRFLTLLGIKKKQGKPSPYPPDAWLQYGSRIYEMEHHRNKSPEQALDIVARELAAVYLDPPERRTLQRWRDTYRKEVTGWEESGYPPDPRHK